MTATGSVVVGADGSPAARTAIEYALQDAARRGVRLRVVAAAQLPQYWAGGYGMSPVPAPLEIAEEMRSIARQQVEEIRSARPEFGAVRVTVEGATGAPGPILVEAAQGADLLVLGHRGRGAVRSALLGSVGLHCVLHATCPVTIVPQANVAEPVPAVAAAQA